MAIQIVMIVAFFGVTALVGALCRRKASTTDGFVLGGRNIGPWLSAFAYGTSYFSAVVFIGYAGQFGWQFGLSAVWIGIGNAIIGSLLVWILAGRRTRVMSKHFGAATMPEFFFRRYDCASLKTAAAVIIFLFLIPYSASVYKGLSGLFSLLFNIDFRWCIAIMAIITALYVVLGGYLAAAVNDFIQGIIMLIGIVLVISGVLRGRGGFDAAVTALSQIPSAVKPELAGAFTGFFGPEPLALLSVVILTSVGAWGLPQMVHKFYSVKNEQSIKLGSAISTVFALVVAGGSYFLGAFGRLFYSPDGAVPAFDSIVPFMLSSSLGDLLLGIVMVLVLSASMSTLSSVSITSSSAVALDLVGKRVRGAAQLTLLRVLCAFFIALSVVLALIPSALITSLMSISWGALAGSFLGPYIYGLFDRRANKYGAFACFISGVGITALNTAFSFTSPTMAGAGAILLSLIIMPLVSRLTPKPDAQYTDYVFSCYDIKVTAPQKTTLRG